jgi:hypothetical protein
MFKSLRVSLLIFAILLTSGCVSSTDTEVNPQTGMLEFLCPTFKDLMEDANKEVWDLTEFKTSLKSTQDALLEVMSDAATISVVTEQPATAWLQDIGANGRDFLNFFSSSSDGSTEELYQIYGRWKANYESLKTYCP